MDPDEALARERMQALSDENRVLREQIEALTPRCVVCGGKRTITMNGEPLCDEHFKEALVF